jgi:hypothetical protein
MTLKKLFKNQKGQAIFELIIFLPFLLILYNLMVVTGSSINGSINQQVAVRGYTFYLLKNNSKLPLKDTLIEAAQTGGIQSMGMYSIGYADYLEGGSVPVAPCYKISGLDTAANEACDESPSGGRSNFVRIYSAFGICGNNYVSSGTTFSESGNKGSGSCNRQ